MPDSAVLADYLDVTRARAKLLCSVEHGNDHALRSTSGRATRPMGEAMVALVLVDHWLRQRGQCGK